MPASSNTVQPAPSESSASSAVSPYIGRFAPSPSGPLHLGSLVCALASFLDARTHTHSQWLVRIEDIDPPREQRGASLQILQSLKDHGLHWDGEVMYQSRRSHAYTKILNNLNQRRLSYRCTCTRKRLSSLNGIYDGHCRLSQHASEQAASIRLNTDAIGPNNAVSFNDIIQGQVSEDFSQSGDFIIHRKDGLFAYQIAVTSDDIEQRISHIVRGNDLLATTPKQLLIYRILNAAPPRYAHIPVIVGSNGLKLSKQNHAQALAEDQALNNLRKACTALGIFPPSHIDSIENLLQFARSQWNIHTLKGQSTICEAELEAHSTSR